MYFQELSERLITHLRERVSSGELTERGLARISGVSQPHIHHALKGKRILSPQFCDKILRQLRMDLLDLMKPDDLLEWRARQR